MPIVDHELLLQVKPIMYSAFPLSWLPAGWQLPFWRSEALSNLNEVEYEIVHGLFGTLVSAWSVGFRSRIRQGDEYARRECSARWTRRRLRTQRKECALLGPPPWGRRVDANRGVISLADRVFVAADFQISGKSFEASASSGSCSVTTRIFAVLLLPDVRDDFGGRDIGNVRSAAALERVVCTETAI